MNEIKTNLAKEVLISQKIPSTQIDKIVETSIKVFSKIPNIYNEIESNVGLIVGKVQSGKTSVMISTTALAFENGHSLVVALLSDTELLLEQNFERMAKTFSDHSKIKVYQVSKNGDFSGATLDELKYMHKNGFKILVCGLKNKTRLTEIANSFSGSGYENDKVLIFDDEGDDISQNTSNNKEKFAVNSSGDYYEKEFSATNKAIKDLKSKFKSFGYISVTATPQSNVMLQRFQHLSPTYVVTTEPGQGYCGLSYFHDEFRNKLIKIIDDNIDLLNEVYGIPESLKNAIAFFVAGCIYRAKNNNGHDFRHSMMIHASRRIKDHKKLFIKIESYTNQIKEGIIHKHSIATKFFNVVQNEYGFISNSNEKINFEDMAEVFDSLKVTFLNGLSAIKNISKIQSIMPYHIFIGGDLLDRGVTISGLAVSYITRESNVAQMDTLLQRARWFGYKADYIETCRVYMTETLDKQFREMVSADESMWDLLVECSETNTSPMDMSFEFYIDTDILIPTSKRKTLFDVAITGLKTSQKYVMMNEEFNEENKSLVNGFRTMFKNEITPVTFGAITHDRLITKAKYVLNFLKEFHFSEEERVCNYNVFKSVFERLQFTENSDIEVLFMKRPDGVEERSTVKPETNEIIGLLQGHSANRDSEDPLYYKGDRYLVDQLPMIQIHMVTLKNDVKLDMSQVMLKKGSLVPMIAWMFPESSYERIVVKKIDLE